MRCWRTSRLACARARRWSSEPPAGTAKSSAFGGAVEQAGTGFVFGANFSYGVNLFFQIVQAAAPALTHGYRGHITERHHIHKKDAPSGTAAALQRILEQASGERVEITSEREGEVTGTHTLELTSSGDRIVLTHEAKSRRTFAEGAVLAAEWIAGKNRLLRIQGHLRAALKCFFTTEDTESTEKNSSFTTENTEHHGRCTEQYLFNKILVSPCSPCPPW